MDGGLPEDSSQSPAVTVALANGFTLEQAIEAESII